MTSVSRTGTGDIPPLLVVTGMAKERRVSEGPGAVVVGSGGDAAQLRRLIGERDEPFSAVLSFGIAGGLDPRLKPGDAIVASEVLAGDRRWATDQILAERLLGRLREAGAKGILAAIAGSDSPVMSAAEKAAVRQETGAAAVDMESHIAAEFAAARSLPFAAVRVVCDPAGRSLPPLVATALRPDGGVNLATILRSLAGNPGQLAALPRLAADARAAFRALSRCGDLLGVGRGLPDFREFLRDVP